MKPESILPGLFERRRTLRRQFEAIDADPVGQQYPQVRSGQRTKATTEWLQALREHTRSLTQTTIPELKQNHKTAVEAARMALETGVLGRVPTANPLEPGDYASMEDRRRATAHAQHTALFERLIAETARNTAFTRWQLATTEELAARVNNAFDQARTTPFDWDGWYTDRLAIRAVLGARAGNDQRAEMALRRFHDLETVLVERTVAGEPTVLDALEREVAELRGLAERAQVLPTGETLGLEELTSYIDALERSAARASGNPAEVRRVMDSQGLEGYVGTGSATGAGGAQ